ncbi:MAG: SRPBCC family protein [Pseudonocardiaceae bacterium]
MKQHVIDVEVTSSAQPEAVYALLRNGASWPEFSSLGSFELERPAPDGSEGVGAIRVFRTGRITSREEIVLVEEPHRFAYVLLSGLPIRDYRAEVELSPTSGGTVIHWHSTFRGTLPGVGWLVRRQLEGFLAELAQGLAARAASPAA